MKKRKIVDKPTEDGLPKQLKSKLDTLVATLVNRQAPAPPEDMPLPVVGHKYIGRADASLHDHLVGKIFTVASIDDKKVAWGTWTVDKRMEQRVIYLYEFWQSVTPVDEDEAQVIHNYLNKAADANRLPLFEELQPGDIVACKQCGRIRIKKRADNDSFEAFVVDNDGDDGERHHVYRHEWRPDGDYTFIGIDKPETATRPKQQKRKKADEAESSPPTTDNDNERPVKGKKMASTMKEVQFEREGKKIILPEGMSTKKAIEWLQKKEEQDELDINVNYTIDAYPLEGAYALLCVLQDRYGFTNLQETPSFFGPRPPHMIGMEIDPGVSVQVPWGRMGIPGITGFIHPDVHMTAKNEVKFKIVGTVKRKHEDEVNEIADMVRKYIKEKSVFRGKAMRVAFPAADEEPFSVDPAYLPKVMDVLKVNEKDLVFPDVVEELVQTSLFAPIEHTQVCREQRIPLKRGILLEGPYGTGKTMAAYVTAKKCVENNWTFLYVEKASDLDRAISLAKLYQPACIFAEDIDRAVEGAERTAAIDNILNTIDGIDNKESEIMVVLTTNHVNNINRAMLRPGRLDAVVPVRAPDGPAVQRLVRLYARNLLAEETDLTTVGATLDGQIPAVIREAVERSKLGAIRRLRPGETLSITTSDLITAANSMMAQIELLKPAPEDKRSEREKAADVLGAHIAKAFKGSGENGVSKHDTPVTKHAAPATQ